MKRQILSVLLFFAGLAFSAEQIKLTSIPSALEFENKTVLLDGASASSANFKIQMNNNAVVNFKDKETVLIDGKPEQVLALNSSVKNEANAHGRHFFVYIPAKIEKAVTATHLVIECGAKKQVNGAWGPLGILVKGKSGSYGGHFYQSFLNKNGLLCTYAVELKKKDGKYSGNGLDLTEISLGANASQSPNTLYIRSIYLAIAKTKTERTISIVPVTEPNKLKVYPAGSKVVFLIKGVKGTPAKQDFFQWKLCDYTGKTVVSGEEDFSENDWTSGKTLTIDGSKIPAGYYALYGALKSDGASVGFNGSRPDGFTTFGFLPDIKPLSLKYADQSRFGAQGTNYLYEKHPLNPLYNVLGIRWVYANARPIWARPTPDKKFEYRSDNRLKNYGGYRIEENRYAYLINMFGVPPFMLKYPSYLTAEQIRKDPSRLSQSFPLKDPAAYTELVGQLMEQECRRRKLHMPHMSRNYYEMHWEPDWHWRGTDDEFIQYYECARKAMDENDPTAVLTAANYGVIDVGNNKLEKLFKKGLGKYINGVTTHLYLMKAGWPEAAGLDLECRKLRQLTDQYVGKNAPIFQTEGGSRYSGSPRKPQTLREHLGICLRAHLITLGEGLDSTWFFYTADHSKLNETLTGYGLFFNTDSKGRLYGADNVEPKPLAMGVAAMTRLLDGTRTIGRLDYFGDGIYVYAFRRNGQILLALWSPFKEQNVKVDIGSKPVTKYDVMGNASKISPVKGSAELILNDIPIYLLGIDPAVIPTDALTPPDVVIAGTAFKGKSANVLTLEKNEKAISVADGKMIPGNLASGIYRLTERNNAGKILSAKLLNVEGAVKIKSIFTNKKGFHVICGNRSAEPLDVSLGAHYVRKSNTFGTDRKFFIAGNSEKEILIPFSDKPEKSMWQTMTDLLSFHWTSEPGNPVYDPLHGIPVWTFELSRDGDLCSSAKYVWAGANIESLKEYGPVYGEEALSYQQTKWKGKKDFSFRVKMKENRNGITLYAEVKDDVPCRKLLKTGLWRTDAVIAAFGSGREDGSEWRQQRVFMIRMNEKGEAETGELIGAPAREYNQVKNLTGKVIRDEIAKTTTYELNVPFELFGSPDEIRKDGCFGFGLSVHDVDDFSEAEKDAHRAAGLFGGAPFFMQSMKIGTIYLK